MQFYFFWTSCGVIPRSFIVGWTYHVSRGGVVNVLRSQTFGWHSKNSLCSHRTAMSCPCLIAHAFRQRTASSEPSQQPFKAHKRRLRPVPPPPVSQEWGTPTRTKCLTPPLLPEVLGASWVAAVAATTRGRRTRRCSTILRSSPSCACWAESTRPCAS